ncbi:MAG TPA: hypothetical protein VNZ45_03495, partial [Bacteroidia bacterium]|nr:hypothetical protein [Bacteroidia bacterium]
MSTVGPASIATDAAGFVYLTGSYIDSAFLGPYKVFSKHNAAYIAKFDSSGNIKWLQHSVAPNKDYTCAVWPSSMALDKSANIYITGRFADTITFGTYTLIASPMLGSLEAYTVKYDSAGNVKWASGSKMVGNNVTASSWGRSIAIDGHGNPYITGLFIDTVSFDTFIMRSSGQGQTYLVKYDNNNGKVIWGIQTHDLSSNNWWGYSVTADTLPKGGAYIAASAYEYSATSPYKVKIQNDTFQLATTDKGVGILIHFDSASNVLQGTMFSEGGEDDGDAVMAVSSGRTVYMAGDISGVGIAFGNDTLKPGSESPFLARWSPFANNLTGINNIQETAQSVKLFPNPNNGKFTLEVKSEELITKSVVEIYNMVGEQIYCSS